MRRAHIGTDKDGQPIYRDFTPAEEAARDAEEAAYEASKNDPPPPPPRDLASELDALKTKIAAAEAEIEKLKAPK